MFPSDVTEINELVSFAKREGTVYYFNGPMPVFSHAESDRPSFRMFTSQLVLNGNCTQAQIVRAFGIRAISMKRYVKQYRQSGAAGFFKARAGRPAPGADAGDAAKGGGANAAGARAQCGGPGTGDQIRHAGQSHQGGSTGRAHQKKVNRWRTKASGAWWTGRQFERIVDCAPR